MRITLPAYLVALSILASSIASPVGTQRDDHDIGSLDDVGVGKVYASEEASVLSRISYLLQDDGIGLFEEIDAVGVTVQERTARRVSYSEQGWVNRWLAMGGEGVVVVQVSSVIGILVLPVRYQANVPC
jgi:hypothetical protein